MRCRSWVRSCCWSAVARLDRVGHLIGCATVIAAFVLGLAMFFATIGADAGDRMHSLQLFSWFTAGTSGRRTWACGSTRCR